MWRSEASGKSVEHLQLFHSPSFNACAFLSLSAKAEIQKKHPSKNCTSNSWIFKGLQVRPVDCWNCQPFWLVNCRCLGFSVERWSVGTGSYCWWLNHHPVLSQIGSSSHQIKAKRCKKYIFNCGKFLKRRPCWPWWTCSQMGAALGTRPTASSGHKLGAKPFSSKTWGLIFISSMLLESCRKLEKVLPMAGRGPKKHTHIVDMSFQLFQYIGFQGWTSPPRRRFRCSNAFRLAPQYHAWNDLNGLSQVTWSTWIWREFCIFLLMILDDIWWYETTLKTY